MSSPDLQFVGTKEECFQAFMTLNVGDSINLTRVFPTPNGDGFSQIKLTMNEKMMETNCKNRECFNAIWDMMTFAMEKTIEKNVKKNKKPSNKKKSRRNRKRRRQN